MHFETVRATSASMSLEDVVGRLRDAPDVDGIVLTGSGSRGPLGPASDVDLVVVLTDAPSALALAPDVPFEVVFTHIDGRAADVILTTVASLSESRHEPLMRWVADGTTLLDRSGAIESLRERAESDLPEPWPEGADFEAWWSACFELVKAERYASSGDDRYREAAEWIVSAAFADTLRAYFHVRALPWKGEKDSLALWEETDAAMLERFRAFFAARSLGERVAALRGLAQHALAPVGGVWEDGTGPRSATWEALVHS